MEAAQALSYLNGKTILLIGDSVDRFTNDYMCEHLLPNSTKSFRWLHKDSGSLAKIDKPDMYFDYFAEPHLCEVSGAFIPPPQSSLDASLEDLSASSADGLFNFKIYSFLFYGVTGEEDEWKFKDQTRAPRQYEGKIRLFKEALDRIGLTKPDLIITHSV